MKADTTAHLHDIIQAADATINSHNHTIPCSIPGRPHLQAMASNSSG